MRQDNDVPVATRLQPHRAVFLYIAMFGVNVLNCRGVSDGEAVLAADQQRCGGRGQRNYSRIKTHMGAVGDLLVR